jgi:hypothetical protein
MRNLTVIVALVLIGLAGPSLAKNLIYVSEKKAVCYIPTPDGLRGGTGSVISIHRHVIVWLADQP